MLTAKELVDGEIDLISLPDIYLKLKALLDDPDYALLDVGKLIGTDPALTVRLLRLVNSPYFGVATKIDTVTKAVNLLGTQQVHDLVLATSVAEAFSGMSTEVMHMRTFWQESVHCGVMSRLVAAHCNMLDSERLFVAGLLRDIGHLIMYRKMPESCQETIIHSRQEQRLLFTVERERFGFDYAQVGGELLAAWNLPAALKSAIRFHTAPGRAEEFEFEAAIVHLASVVTETREWAGGSEAWAECADPVAWQLTNLSVAAIEPLLEEAETQAAATMELILPDLSEAC